MIEISKIQKFLKIPEISRKNTRKSVKKGIKLNEGFGVEPCEILFKAYSKGLPLTKMSDLQRLFSENRAIEADANFGPN